MAENIKDERGDPHLHISDKALLQDNKFVVPERSKPVNLGTTNGRIETNFLTVPTHKGMSKNSSKSLNLTNENESIVTRSPVNEIQRPKLELKLNSISKSLASPKNEDEVKFFIGDEQQTATPTSPRKKFLFDNIKDEKNIQFTTDNSINR